MDLFSTLADGADHDVDLAPALRELGAFVRALSENDRKVIAGIQSA